MMIYGAATIVGILFLWLFIKYGNIKRQIKSMESQLIQNRSHHRPLSVVLCDRQINTLAAEINRLMEDNEEALIEGERKGRYLKGSIADISHDMRTPLTSIIGYIQLLRRTDLSAAQTEYVEICLNKARYLQRLLEDFFELSAIEAKEAPCALEKVDLAGIVSEVILANYSEFEQRHIVPVFQEADEPVDILGDTRMLHRVLQNLISNCLRYASGNVVFHIIKQKDVRLTIQNPVSNPSEIEAEHLFERFYRADASRSGQGAGLGLSIVKLLMEKQGGRADAKIEENRLILGLTFQSARNKPVM